LVANGLLPLVITRSKQQHQDHTNGGSSAGACILPVVAAFLRLAASIASINTLVDVNGLDVCDGYSPAMLFVEACHERDTELLDQVRSASG